MTEPLQDPTAPDRCPKCSGRMNVYMTRRVGAKLVRVRRCKRYACGGQYRTEERILAGTPARRKAEPRPAA